MINRYPRFPWKKNHKCEQPSRLIFYDCETLAIPVEDSPTNYRHRLRFGVASAWIHRKAGWQRDSYLQFTNAAELWEFFYSYLRPRKPTWVYAHNQAFDFTVSGGWGELDKGNLRILVETERARTANQKGDNNKSVWRGKTALDGLPFILECDNAGRRVKFVDTLNYWNVPLSKLGEWVEHNKLEFEPFPEINDDAWKYCRRDVEIIEKAVLTLMDMWKRENLGNWQPTIAGLAYSSYRHGKETSTIVPHGDTKYDETEKMALRDNQGETILDPYEITQCEKRAYYGGKTKIFFQGDVVTGALARATGKATIFDSQRAIIPGPTYVVDVNSLFPYCMYEYLHPVELIDAIRLPGLTTALRLIDQFWCCADVQLTGAEHDYPKRCNGRVCYYTGDFSTTLCGPELVAAYKSGIITGVANLCIYRSGRPFRNFINAWHGRRKTAAENGHRVESRFCKHIMNSLYGKLAQQSAYWQTCGHIIPPVRWGGFIGQVEPGKTPCFMRAIAGVSQYQSTVKSCLHTFVAAAASVTSWARTYMRQIISALPHNSVVYTDTDSLFLLTSGMEKLQSLGLVHSNELGKFKLCGKHDNARIWGWKDYELDGVRTIAGLSANADEVGFRIWDQINFEGVRQIIQHDPDGTILQNTVKFAPKSQIPATVVGYDGWCKPVEV